MTCNDCGREIGDCDRNGCREVRGTVWDKAWCEAKAKAEPDCDITVGGQQLTPVDGDEKHGN
jgi:hypothetical protein